MLKQQSLDGYHSEPEVKLNFLCNSMRFPSFGLGSYLTSGCYNFRFRSFPVTVISGSDHFRFRSVPVPIISCYGHFRFRPFPVPTISGYHHKLMKIKKLLIKRVTISIYLCQSHSFAPDWCFVDDVRIHV